MDSVEQRRERYAKALDQAEVDYHDLDGRESDLTCREWMAQQMIRLVDAERAREVREMAGYLHGEPDRLWWGSGEIWVSASGSALGTPKLSLFEWMHQRADVIEAGRPGWTPWGRRQRTPQSVEGER